MPSKKPTKPAKPVWLGRSLTAAQKQAFKLARNAIMVDGFWFNPGKPDWAANVKGEAYVIKPTKFKERLARTRIPSSASTGRPSPGRTSSGGRISQTPRRTSGAKGLEQQGNQVKNPASGRWVSKSGPVGKAILATCKLCS